MLDSLKNMIKSEEEYKEFREKEGYYNTVLK